MSHPKDVELPEDDATAMDIICDLAHMRHECVSLHPSAKLVLDIAVLDDKYDMLSCCFLAAHIWLASTEKDDKTQSLMQRIQASFLFRAREAFRRLTKELIESHAWTVGDLHKQIHLDARLPAQLLCKYHSKPDNLRVISKMFAVCLEKQRDNARTLLLRVLDKMATCPCKNPDEPCEKWKHAQPLVLKAALGQDGLLFSTRLVMSNIKKCYDHLVSIKLGTHLKPGGVYQDCGILHPGEGTTLWWGREWNNEVDVGRKVEMICRGLCLDCITEGKETADECKSHPVSS